MIQSESRGQRNKGTGCVSISQSVTEINLLLLKTLKGVYRGFSFTEQKRRERGIVWIVDQVCTVYSIRIRWLRRPFTLMSKEDVSGERERERDLQKIVFQAPCSLIYDLLSPFTH